MRDDPKIFTKSEKVFCLKPEKNISNRYVTNSSNRTDFKNLKLKQKANKRALV